MAHYALDTLTWRDLGNGWTEATVWVAEGSTADNPASTKGPLYGPARITYQRAPDGGIETHVRFGPRFTAEEKASLQRQNDAIRRGLS